MTSVKKNWNIALEIQDYIFPPNSYCIQTIVDAPDWSIASLLGRADAIFILLLNKSIM